MALRSNTVWEVRDTATTGNVNGSGFAITSTNFLTDLAATSGTGNSPVVSSASYSFVAGDVGAWVYIKSGTNWTPGWYQIASVSGGAATLNAAIGAAMQVSAASGAYLPNTVAGVATVASPTAGTFGVDYSQQNTAQFTTSSATTSAANAIILDAQASKSMLGNVLQIISGTNFTPGWYEIIAVAAGVSYTVDRNCTTAAGSGGVINIGGACCLNANEDAYYEMLPAFSQVWIKKGTYTFTGAISVASTNAAFVTGYKAARGDACNRTDRPTFVAGANAVSMGAGHSHSNIQGTTTDASGFVFTSNISITKNVKITNTSATAHRAAVKIGRLVNCELISQNGQATGDNSTNGAAICFGCWLHDSFNGVSTNGATLTNCIVSSCGGDAIANNNFNGGTLINNLFYGTEAKLNAGMTGVNQAYTVLNNLFYGFSTAWQGGSITNTYIQYNNFFNNTVNINTAMPTDPTNYSVAPAFNNVSQLTGSTATTSGSVLTQASANFSGITDGIDFLHVVSGTGVTVGCYLITGHTSNTLTVNNPLGTSSGGNVVWWITQGNDFRMGPAVAGLGWPNFSNMGALQLAYPDPGPMQRQEPVTGGMIQSRVFSGF